MFRLKLDCLAIQNSPAVIYLLKVNNRNTRTRCEICSTLTTKTPEQRQWRRSGVFVVNFEKYFTICTSISSVNFEHVIAGWETPSNSSQIKIISRNFDNAQYKATVIFQKSSGFQKWEPISSNSKGYIV